MKIDKYKLEYLNPNDLKDYANNAKIHSEAQIEKLSKEMNSVGFLVPIIIDAEGTIVSGHGRKYSAIKAGLEKVPVHRLPQDISPERVRAMRLFDNKIAESAWDSELLKAELHELATFDDFDFSFTGFEPFATETNAPFNPRSSSEQALGNPRSEDDVEPQLPKEYTGSKELDENDYSTFDQTCPKCGFEFDVKK